MKGHSTRSFFAIAVLAALAATLGCSRTPTRTLTFRIDRAATNTDPNVTSEQVATIIESRFKWDGPSYVTAKALDKDRVFVTMYYTDQNYIDAIKEALTIHGQVDLRILASPLAPRHRVAIEEAEKHTGEFTSSDGKTARWVKVDPRLANIYLSQSCPVRDEADGSTSALAIIGPFDIHTEHFQRATPTIDTDGRDSLAFEMTDQGALMLEQLTGGHLPDVNNNSRFALGIFLNDELVTAPNLNDVIKKNGQITGITPQQMRQLEAILSAGKMPAALVLENETKP